MGSTVSTILRIRNLSNSDITLIYVYDVDSFDFGAAFRPDKVFNGTSIAAQECLERTIELYTIASNCPFTMKMEFRNGVEDVFRMNYKCVYDNTEPSFRHITKSHRIYYKKTGPRVMEIIIENTAQQIENQKAEHLINAGCRLMEMGQYTEASIKFMEAAQKANENKTIIAARQQSQKLKIIKETTDVDKRAKTLNNEGLQLLRENKFFESLKKFQAGLDLATNLDTISLIEDNLKIAKEAKVNQDAKKLNQEGLLFRRNNQNEAAIQKFEEALRVALDTNLISSIKINMAETLNKEGKKNLEEAWDLEMSSSEEAIHKFAKSKFLFQQADSVKPNTEYHNNIVLVDCKIEGGKHFSDALLLESEGSRLIDKTVKSERSEDCKIAKDKYEEAWKHYKKAKNKFEEGRKKGEINFERSLGLTNDALHGIETILNELEKAELEIALATKPT